MLRTRLRKAGRRFRKVRFLAAYRLRRGALLLVGYLPRAGRMYDLRLKTMSVRDFCDWRTNRACKMRRGRAVFIGTGCPRPWVYSITFTQGLDGLFNFLRFVPNTLMPSFDFHSRYGLFTYSQSDGLDAFDVVNHFASLGAECIIGREDHADGGTHLHCFADFGRKRRFRRPLFADVGGYHPNIQPSRGTPGTAYDYAIKDGDVVGGGLERPVESGGRSRTTGGSDDAMAALVAIDDEQTFWATCREVAPGLLLRCHSSLESYAKRRFAARVQEYSHPQQLVFRDEGILDLVAWREANLCESSGSSGGRYVTCALSRGGSPGPSGGAKCRLPDPPLFCEVYISWFRPRVLTNHSIDEDPLSFMATQE